MHSLPLHPPLSHYIPLVLFPSSSYWFPPDPILHFLSDFPLILPSMFLSDFPPGPYILLYTETLNSIRRTNVNKKAYARGGGFVLLFFYK